MHAQINTVCVVLYNLKEPSISLGKRTATGQLIASHKLRPSEKKKVCCHPRPPPIRKRRVRVGKSPRRKQLTDHLPFP